MDPKEAMRVQAHVVTALAQAGFSRAEQLHIEDGVEQTAAIEQAGQELYEVLDSLFMQECLTAFWEVWDTALKKNKEKVE